MIFKGFPSKMHIKSILMETQRLSASAFCSETEIFSKEGLPWSRSMLQGSCILGFKIYFLRSAIRDLHKTTSERGQGWTECKSKFKCVSNRHTKTLWEVMCQPGRNFCIITLGFPSKTHIFDGNPAIVNVWFLLGNRDFNKEALPWLKNMLRTPL